MEISFQEIVEKTLAAIIAFFETPTIANQFTADKHSKLILKFKELKDKNNNYYSVIKDFLINNNLSDTQSSILTFAKTLPDYVSFKDNLNHSLCIHEPFWNQVHQNLILAKRTLK